MNLRAHAAGQAGEIPGLWEGLEGLERTRTTSGATGHFHSSPSFICKSLISKGEFRNYKG